MVAVAAAAAVVAAAVESEAQLAASALVIGRSHIIAAEARR
jgi:hypothetical protein